MPFDYSELYVTMCRHKDSDNPPAYTYIVTNSTDLDSWIVDPSDVEKDGCLYESDRRNRAYAALVLLTLFEEDELVCPSGCVPVKIAVEDRPTVALYLWAYERLAREEVAELLGVKPDTVTRYKSRLFRG